MSKVFLAERPDAHQPPKRCSSDQIEIFCCCMALSWKNLQIMEVQQVGKKIIHQQHHTRKKCEQSAHAVFLLFNHILYYSA